MGGENMAGKRDFEILQEPWKLDRLSRMRYLINHLVWKNSIQQVLHGDDWMISKSDSGQMLVALWPTSESVRQCVKFSENTKLKSLSNESIQDDLFSRMYEDECIAAFPDRNLEYEILTVSEMKKAIYYAYLLKKSKQNNLSDDETNEFAKYFRFNLKGKK